MAGDQPKSMAETLREMAAQDPNIVNLLGGPEKFEKTVTQIQGNDTKFEQRGGVFFHEGSTPKETGNLFTQIHVEDYRANGRPSLMSLVAHHLDEVGLDKNSPHYKAALLVAARAELDAANKPQYHNTDHYADVTAQTAEYIKHNNELARQGVKGVRAYSPEEIADSITAAVGHDLEHPGGKNALPGQKPGEFDKYRLEDQSFSQMEPLLREAGLPAQAIDDIHLMIRGTSVDGPDQMVKKIAKIQESGEKVDWAKVDPENKFPELKALADRPDLVQRATMLEAADTGASANMGLRSNMEMTRTLQEEWAQRGYSDNITGPKARAGFGKFAVGETLPSVAARDAVGENFNNMMANATREGQAMDLRNSVAAMAKADPRIVEEFGGQEKFDAVMKKIGTLDTQFTQRGGVFFALGDSPQATADAFTKIHVDQYRETGRPSLPALVAHHLDEIGLSKDSPHYKAALLAATRAEVDLAKDPQYHNKNHYADVTAQVAEFVKKNNELAEKGVPGAHKLTPEEMADSITAAVAHDIDHPGGKNAEPGKFADSSNRLKLEEQSFKAIEPLLKEAGLPQNSIDDIHTMIQTTSPDGPHGILKQIAKAQQEGRTIEWEKLDPKGTMPELKELAEKLQKDPKLTARAAMLEDADLGASAFEGMKSNVKMSEVFSQELQERNYNENLRGPSARQGFSDFVVGEGPASAAAQAAVGQNYKEMYGETRPIANKLKAVGAGVWQDGVEGGTPFTRTETTGMNQMQVDGAVKAMKELGLNPQVEPNADPSKTVIRLQGEDVAKLQSMRKDVIASMDWKPASTGSGALVNRVATAPLGNDEIKALNNALKAEGIVPTNNKSTTLGDTIRVTGGDAVTVATLKEQAQSITAPTPPKAPVVKNNGPAGGNNGPTGGTSGPPAGGTPPGNSGSPGANNGPGTNGAPQGTGGEAPSVPPAAKAETPPPPPQAKGPQEPTPPEKAPVSKFMGEVTPEGNTRLKIGASGTANAAIGGVMAVQGLVDAYERGDKLEGAVAGTNLVTSGLQATETVLATTGKSLGAVGKAIPGLGTAATIADGVIQVTREDTTQHKVERGVVVGTTAATGFVVGGVLTTAAEAGGAGLVATLGGGAVATAAVAAAPVVITAAAVAGVAYVGNKALEAKRGWDEVDRQIAESGVPKKRENYKSEDGKPTVLGYQHIATEFLHHSEGMRNENMNGTAGFARDKAGHFKIDDFKKIDLRDPKNLAEVERVLKAQIARDDKIIKENDSIMPKWMRIIGTDSVGKLTDAQRERAGLTAAMQELEMYKKDLRAWDSTHPNDPATTGVKPAVPPQGQPKRTQPGA